MASALGRNAFLLFLALVFTVGLSFVTVGLPYLADQVVMDHVHTPGFDSQVDESSRLKTRLFISHYHLRTVGYACFGAMVLLIAASFATRRKELAMLGGLAFMLPVFAQFAGVMFFLSGLGILNVLWLPVLEISFGLAALGMVIRAPYDLLRWLFCLAGMSSYWIMVYAFIGSGLPLFFLGTFAWLSASFYGDDESEWVREEAVLSLLRIGSARARPALERALTDADGQVRLYAAEALKRLPREG